jgi:hypothetical protein
MTNFPGRVCWLLLSALLDILFRRKNSRQWFASAGRFAAGEEDDA